MENKINLLIFSSLFISCLGSLISLNSKETIVKAEEQPGEEVVPNYYCLRDEYIHYTQNQTNTGLCWAYGAHHALSTTYEKATGEYTEFSEVWTSMTYSKKSGSYKPNAGGNFINFESPLVEYGLVYDQDLPTTKAWLTNKDERDTFIEFYKKDANFLVRQNLERVSYSTKTQKDLIKKHILNNGAFHIAATWEKTEMVQTTKGNWIYAKNPNQSASGAHAVALIGWDDNISVDFGGTIWTGAWIVQNSYGERETEQYGSTYIFYNDNNIWGTADGYIFKDKTATSSGINFIPYIAESSSNVINHKAGTFSNDKNIHDEVFKTKNVFYSQDVDLTYQYTISPNTTIYSINVFNSDIDVTSYFDISLDTVNKKIKVNNFTGYPLEYGTYKIKFGLKRNSERQFGYATFYVMSGGEINTLLLEEINGINVFNHRGDVLNHGASPLIMDNNGFYYLHNSHTYSPNEREVKFSTYTSEGDFTFSYYINMLDDINHIEVDGETVVSDVINGTNHLTIPYAGLSFDNRSITKVCDVITNHNTKYSFNFVIDYALENERYVYMRYDTSGGLTNNHEKIIRTKDCDFELNEGFKLGYKFLGWFYDKGLTDPLERTLDNKYVYKDSKINKLSPWSSSNTYVSGRENYYYKDLEIATVYAKWSYVGANEINLVMPEKAEPEKTFTISLDVLGLTSPKVNVVASLYIDGDIYGYFANNQIKCIVEDIFNHTYQVKYISSYNGNTYTMYSAIVNYSTTRTTPTAAIIAFAAIASSFAITLTFIVKKKKKMLVKKNMRYSLDHNFELIGRYLKTPDGIKFFHNYSGFRFAFKGSKLTVYFEYKGSPSYLELVRNDDFANSIRFEINDNIKSFSYEFNKEISDEIGIYKVNEDLEGNITFISLEIDGEICPIINKRKYEIEVIGDSTVAGYGILANLNAEEVNQYRYHDGMKSAFALALQKIQAKPAIFSASGWGVYGSNWTMDPYYGIIDCINDVSATCHESWDYTNINPQLVVISLGTNDVSLYLNHGDDKETVSKKLIENYLKLIDLKIKQYPKTKILIVDGTLHRGDVYNYTHRVYEAANNKYPSQIFEIFISGDGIAYASHSTLKSQIEMSDKLANKILEVLKYDN